MGRGRLSDRYEVAILGGGIVGCALAYHLTHDHGVAVFLADPKGLAAGASGTAGGILSTQCWNDWDVELVERSRQEYTALEGGASLVQGSGGIRVVSTPAGEEGLERLFARLTARGLPVRWVDREELRGMFPEGRFDDVRRALLGASDALVDPAGLTRTYARLARDGGAVLEYGLRKVQVSPQSGGWVIRTSEGDARASRLVVAAGAWTSHLLAELGSPLPLCAYRTRACLIRRSPTRPFPFLLDHTPDTYLRPVGGTGVLVGDGTDLSATDPSDPSETGEEGFLEDVADYLRLRFPAWAKAPVVETWDGFCVATPDRRPMMGPVPGREGLFVASGLNEYGVMRAGEATRRLAAGVARDDWGPLAPALPSRFEGPPRPFRPAPGFTLEETLPPSS